MIRTSYHVTLIPDTYFLAYASPKSAAPPPNGRTNEQFGLPASALRLEDRDVVTKRSIARAGWFVCTSMTSEGILQSNRS